MDQQQDSMGLLQLEHMPAQAINLLPQVSFIMVEDDNTYRGYTALHHNAHFNITSLLNEKGQTAYKEDTLSLLPGFVGDYPSAIWYLKKHQLADFITQLQAMKSENDYFALKSTYGIRRTHIDFWYYSDLLHKIAKQYKGIEFGLFDYNRLENR
ncbi:fatty acid cis/trans isomerase [Pseudoalteromonas sp. '520P1 No. 423']|uniref:fatty acid cis/trans isomerase n=1 Tax=Pseudoalteromonas sp. '520P1 No. 423' TaxID=1690037 RepID=UPI000A6C5EE2